MSFTEMGLEALDRQHYDAAINMLRQALGEDQTDQNARFGLARALHGRGYLTEAISEYRAVLHEDPALELGHRLIAEAYLLSGSPREALNHLDIALRNAPNDPDLLMAHGSAQLELGHVESALADFHTASRLNPGSEVTHLLIAACHRAQDDIEGERRALEQLLRINPHSAAGLNDLARLDLMDGDYGTALERLISATANAPKSPVAWTNRAIALSVHDDPAAQTVWQTALECNEAANDDGLRTPMVDTLHEMAQKLISTGESAENAGLRQQLANGALPAPNVI